MSLWIHGSSTGHLDLSNDIVAILGGESVTAAAINAGGTGYVVGDILGITETGGTANISAQIEVTSVAAGVIDGVRIYNSGSYSTNPSTLTGNALTGGTGSSATIDLTMAATGWTVDRDSVWDGGTEREVIAHGNGSGSDGIYVGWRTFSNVGGDYYNWECHGMTGYSASFDINEQPGVSVGDHEAGDPDDRGCYMILQNTSFNWWLNLNSYRIILCANIGSNYFQCYLGWGNRFGTSTEYPYPMYISTPTWEFDMKGSTTEEISSIIDPWIGNNTTGVIQNIFYTPAGGWLDCINRKATSPTDDVCVVPTQKPQFASTTPSSEEDRFMSLTQGFDDLIWSLSSGADTAGPAQLRPTGSNDDYPMFPCFIVQSVPSAALIMEIDEVKWCYAFGGPSSEDRFIEAGGQAWRIFQNGTRSTAHAYMAIKEAS